ncbi:DUF4439 domain-containing protein [Nocardioides sp. DS6]|uniref:DUF4439 domain-containing protein n=1 Tax=Nocardioides eburneus TaxID=3231482 RepID=A0ABV3STZ5_9ACTN
MSTVHMSTARVAALQTALAAEHAAIYVYGVLGGRTSASQDPTLADSLRTAYDDHVTARDALIDRVVAAGSDPVGSSAAYARPGGIDSPSGVRRAALQVERRCAAAYLAGMAAVTGTDRRLLVGALGDTAVRELAFGGAPETFPGTR